MIRQAVTNDLDIIVKLEQSIFDDAYTKSTISDDIINGRMYVIEQDGLVVGYITTSIVLDEGEIQRIAVDKLHRKLGLGTVLVIDSLNRMREHGVKKVFLEVRSNNNSAIGLYTKCGFAPIATRRRYYKDGSDAIVMSMNLEVQ